MRDWNDPPGTQDR